MFGPEFEREMRWTMGCLGCMVLVLGAALGAGAVFLVIALMR